MDAFSHLLLWLATVYLLAERASLARKLRLLAEELSALRERLALQDARRLPVAPVIPRTGGAVSEAPTPPFARRREWEATAPAVAPAPVPTVAPPPVPAATVASRSASSAPAAAFETAPAVATEVQPGVSWEARIGGHWLSWMGAVTLVIALGVGLQWAVAAGYVTWVFHLPPLAYVAAGWVVGAALIGGGELLRRSLPRYAQGLAGAGVSALYWSTYAGDALYHTLPRPAAMAGLALTGALAIGLALRYDSVVIAWLGVLLAYASPVLLGGGGASPAPLFLYVTALNLAVLGVSVWREWSHFRLAAFLATALLYGLWHAAHYAPLYRGEALLFAGASSALFLCVLALHPLLWRKPTSDADLGLAALNPLLTGGLFYLLLQGDRTNWMGGVAALFAATYWIVSRAIRARRAEADYLEQLFFATALVFALVAVPLQFKGRAMTPAWALSGAALCLVGYRSASRRTRMWGAAALALSIARLVVWDAWLIDGPGSPMLFNVRGFAFGVVLLSLAAAAGAWADEWRRTDREEGPALRWLTGAAFLITALMGWWIWLDVPRAGVAVGWSAVAGLGLGFGWQLRCREVRITGALAALPAVLMAAARALDEPLWTGRAPGLIAALALSCAAAWTYERSRDRMPEESDFLVPAFSGAAAALLMIWSWMDLGRGGASVAWVCIATLLLAAGVFTRRTFVRAAATGVLVLVTAEILLKELTLPAQHLLLFHTRGAALLAAVAGWITYGRVMARVAGEGERDLIPVSSAAASLLGLLWLSLECMDAASRFAPPQWSQHASQFGLSAAWILYAAGSIAVGFRWSQIAARWGGMALLLAAVVKVYLFDLSLLALGYRLVSFLFLAAILLGVSYVYQRQERARGAAPRE